MRSGSAKADRMRWIWSEPKTANLWSARSWHAVAGQFVYFVEFLFRQQPGVNFAGAGFVALVGCGRKENLSFLACRQFGETLTIHIFLFFESFGAFRSQSTHLFIGAGNRFSASQGSMCASRMIAPFPSARAAFRCSKPSLTVGYESTGCLDMRVIENLLIARHEHKLL